MTTLYNKNVMILGASAGINRAFAIAAAREKANIIALDSRKNELADLEREIGNMKSNIRGYLCNFSSLKLLEQMLREIYRNHDKIDLLFVGTNDETVPAYFKADNAALEKLFFSTVTIPAALIRFTADRMLELKESTIVSIPPFNPNASTDAILDGCVNQARKGIISGLSQFSTQSGASLFCIDVALSGKKFDNKTASAAIMDAVLKNKSEVIL
jgi:NAD(P)-dependent dehydrogenase (short-subunit alcohol dehydrogenase family)